MKTLKINFEYCYGINKLEHTFQFSESHKTFSIYGQNGSMKTSLAKTFENISRGEEVSDLIFPERQSVASITFDGKPISKEIFVINSYKAEYKFDKVSTLLVNKKLQEKFRDVHQNIDKQKEQLLSKLKASSGIKKLDEIEKEISRTFYNNDESKFFEALERIEKEISNDDVVRYKNIQYKNIFDEKVVAFLTGKDVQSQIKEYIEKYEELLDKSTYFKKGIFNHSQAEDTANNLEKNGFFEAEHAVFFGEEKITNKARLTEVIEDEKKKILSDKSLQKIFQDLDDKIKKNQNLRDLREFLSENSFIIPELSNLESLKAKLWKYYLHSEKDAFNSLLEEYREGKKAIQLIVEQAEAEKKAWIAVIAIYNERFLVPFRLGIANTADVVLKDEVPTVSFEFVEEGKKREVERDRLMKVLSQGEKRALYLLNIIFEIEARKKEEGVHIFIIDDIADSFDYKNKYAIIEYLRDISKTDGFYQILLSHNFDFHRTVSSRLSMERRNKLVASKSSEGLELEPEHYQNDPFIHWRKHLCNDSFLVAAIPFVRNLAEYSGNEEAENALTEFLHVKQNSEKLTIGHLMAIFKKVLKEEDVNKIKDIGRTYDELLDSVIKEESTGRLESKIVKSIAIRLMAERFIIKEIDSVCKIEKNQTAVLIDNYKEMFSNKRDAIKILDKVQLMTPESIHINSFMYEPLLDMSNEYLDKLYRDVSSLQTSRVGNDQ